MTSKSLNLPTSITNEDIILLCKSKIPKINLSDYNRKAINDLKSGEIVKLKETVEGNIPRNVSIIVYSDVDVKIKTIKKYKEALCKVYQKVQEVESNGDVNIWSLLNLGFDEYFTEDIRSRENEIASILGTYERTSFKKITKSKIKIKNIYLNIDFDSLNTKTHRSKEYINLGESMIKAIKLSDLPSNTCTPDFLVNEIHNDLEKCGCEIDVLEGIALSKKGFGGIWAVGKGSKYLPKLLVATYQGDRNCDKFVSIVGKGVTFDSGGYSVKTGGHMKRMKYDMCGAANTYAIMRSIALNKLPINLKIAIPIVENMIDSQAYKVDDIITMYNNMTVEILNTDAEGRLILADGISLMGADNEVDEIIDIATLTGAVVVALGSEAAMIVGNNDDALREVTEIGEEFGDRSHAMPFYEEYQDAVKSDTADIQNIGYSDGSAGSITAGVFLSKFNNGKKWTHFDIAGTADINTELTVKGKGACGKSVINIYEYLKRSRINK